MLSGKVAIVTGASRGIGRETALTLAGYGATVIVNYCGSKDKAEAVVEEITAAGGTAKAYQGEGSITEALQTILIHMDKYILNEFDPQSGKTIKKVENPVNPGYISPGLPVQHWLRSYLCYLSIPHRHQIRWCRIP